MASDENLGHRPRSSLRRKRGGVPQLHSGLWRTTGGGFITLVNIGIDLLQGQYDQALPALAMEVIFRAIFRSNFCFTPETPLHLEPLSAINGESHSVFVRPQIDDHDAEYLALGLIITAAGTIWIRQREERKKRLADLRIQDSLFNGTRFDDLSRDLSV